MIFLDAPDRPFNLRGPGAFAGGEGTLSDIWGAARESLLLVENSNAAFQALSRAYEERIREVHGITGVQLENPLVAATEERRRREIERPFVPGLSLSGPSTGSGEPETIGEIYERRRGEFEQALFAAGEKIPDRQVADRLMRSVEGEAARLAREADERLGRLLESREGAGKWAALLGGGMAGALADPVTIMSLAAGGGPGAARTVAGRILAAAGREALVNAATEAAIQPMVQAWREKIGLPSGFDEGLRNVGFAAVFGGLFGAGGQGAAEIFSRTIGRTEAARVMEELAARQDLPPPLRELAAGAPGPAARESLAEIRPALAAEARGALDAAARLDHADAQRPAVASPERHDVTVAAADRALREDEAWPGFVPDPAQVARVARAIAGEAVAASADAERSLSRFLAERGGIRDQTGELAQIGADRVRISGNRRLVRKAGDPLDRAREAAAEAGYFNDRYGTPSEAVAKSTIRDLVDALDAELRAPRQARGAEAELAGLEGLVDDIARLAGPAVPDDVLEAAARLATAEDLEAGDALERVLVRAELAAVRQAHHEGARTGDVLPGWSDEELAAASANRGGTPEPDPAAPEPGKPMNPAHLASAEETHQLQLREISAKLGQQVINERSEPSPEIPDPRNVRYAVDTYLNVNAEKRKPADLILQEEAQWAYVLDRNGAVWRLKRPAHENFFNAIRLNEDQHDDALARAGEFAIFRVSRNGSTFSGGFDFFAMSTDKQVRAFRQIKRTLGDGDDLFSVSLWTEKASESTRTAAPPQAPTFADPLAAELADADPDLMIPWEGGERTVKEISEAIRHRQGLASLVEACHV